MRKNKKQNAAQGLRQVAISAAVMERCLLHRARFAQQTDYPPPNVKDWIEYLLRKQCDNMDFIDAESQPQSQCAPEAQS